MEYYVGIDIGGMTIKGIVLDSKGKALRFATILLRKKSRSAWAYP